MCRLLSDSVSSLLLSLTPKLYPVLYFIMVTLNQWWWWDVTLMHSRPHKVFIWGLSKIILLLPTSYFICGLVCYVALYTKIMIVGFTFKYSLNILLELCMDICTYVHIMYVFQCTYMWLSVLSDCIYSH